MQYSYIIVDDDSKSILKIKSVMDSFSNYALCATASNYDDALNVILEHQPDFVFLEINPVNKSSKLTITLVNELFRYLKKVPNIIAISNDSSVAYDAVKFDVLDFLVKPFTVNDVRKSLLRFGRDADTPIIKLNPQPRKAVELDDNDENDEAIPKEIVLKQTPHLPQEILEVEKTKEVSEETNQALLRVSQEIAGLKEAILASLQNKEIQLPTTEIVEELANVLKENLSKDTSVDFSPILEEIRSIKIPETKIVSNPEENDRHLICIKSYGDYRFLELNDIAFMKADNNSTDITMHNGEEITAFKTLKYFEENLPSNFYRIHNSYIVNRDYVSRVHTGNSVCYIKNSKIQVPFSKSYKDLVEEMIALLAGSDFKDI